MAREDGSGTAGRAAGVVRSSDVGNRRGAVGRRNAGGGHGRAARIVGGQLEDERLSAAPWPSGCVGNRAFMRVPSLVPGQCVPRRKHRGCRRGGVPSIACGGRELGATREQLVVAGWSGSTERQSSGDAAVTPGARERRRAPRRAQHELLEEWVRRKSQRESGNGAEAIGKVVGRLRSPRQPGACRRPHGRQVDLCCEREQGLVGADVGSRVLAADVLLPRLQGQGVGAPLVVVQRHADEATRDTSHLRLRDRHEADVRSAERGWDTEWLSVPDGDIESALTGGRQERAGVQVGRADGQSAGIVGGLGERCEVLDHAREARVLHAGARRAPR